MIDAKRGKISPKQLFFVIFVSRIVVSLTYIQSVSVGRFDSDVPIAFALSLPLTLLASVPSVLCAKRNKSPLKNRALSLFYIVFFLFFSSLTVSRFAYFATTKMNPDISMTVFALVTFVAVGYGAYLGIESLGRFASFCGALLVLVTAGVLFFNIKNFECVNLFPVLENSVGHILSNTVLFTCNTIEPVVLLSLSDKTNGDCAKPYFSGVSLAYLCMFMLLLFCSGVLGDGADLQPFPIYTLFQTASIGDMSRLDIFHTSFWIFAVFLKTAVLIFCASTAIKKFNHKNKVAVLSVLAFLGSVIIGEVVGTKIVGVSKILSVALFLVFAVVVPVLFLIFERSAHRE